MRTRTSISSSHIAHSESITQSHMHASNRSSHMQHSGKEGSCMKIGTESCIAHVSCTLGLANGPSEQANKNLIPRFDVRGLRLTQTLTFNGFSFSFCYEDHDVLSLPAPGARSGQSVVAANRDRIEPPSHMTMNGSPRSESHWPVWEKKVLSDRRAVRPFLFKQQHSGTNRPWPTILSAQVLPPISRWERELCSSIVPRYYCWFAIANPAVPVVE